MGRAAVAGLSAEVGAARFFGFEGLDSVVGPRIEPTAGTDKRSLKASWQDFTERPTTTRDQLEDHKDLWRIYMPYNEARLCCVRRRDHDRFEAIEMGFRTCWERDLVPSWSKACFPDDLEEHFCRYLSIL